MKNRNELNIIFKKVLDICFKLHTMYGPGMLESFYESVLCYELGKAGMNYQRQVPVQVSHDGKLMGVGYRLDVLVENEIIIELKSKLSLVEAEHKQILTYLKTYNKRLGLLVNFGEAHLKDGIYRKVHRF